MPEEILREEGIVTEIKNNQMKIELIKHKAIAMLVRQKIFVNRENRISFKLNMIVITKLVMKL